MQRERKLSEAPVAGRIYSVLRVQYGLVKSYDSSDGEELLLEVKSQAKGYWVYSLRHESQG